MKGDVTVKKFKLESCFNFTVFLLSMWLYVYAPKYLPIINTTIFIITFKISVVQEKWHLSFNQ